MAYYDRTAIKMTTICPYFIVGYYRFTSNRLSKWKSMQISSGTGLSFFKGRKNNG